MTEDIVNVANSSCSYDTSITCNVFADTSGDYGSYFAGLPTYWEMLKIYPSCPEELSKNYDVIEEFSKWAIENKVCAYCRFPWKDRMDRCMCDKYWQNKEKIDFAGKNGKIILERQAEQEQHIADNISKDLEDETSLYSQMNRYAAEIKRNVEDKKSYKDFSHPIYKVVQQKNSWYKWFKKLKNWGSINYWKWKIYGIIKAKKVVSIPLEMANSKVIKEASFGVGNVCIKTKGGSVVVVPSRMVDRMKTHYSGGFIVSSMDGVNTIKEKD